MNTILRLITVYKQHNNLWEDRRGRLLQICSSNSSKRFIRHRAHKLTGHSDSPRTQRVQHLSNAGRGMEKTTQLCSHNLAVMKGVSCHGSGPSQRTVTRRACVHSVNYERRRPSERKWQLARVLIVRIAPVIVLSTQDAELGQAASEGVGVSTQHRQSSRPVQATVIMQSYIPSHVLPVRSSTQYPPPVHCRSFQTMYTTLTLSRHGI